MEPVKTVDQIIDEKIIGLQKKTKRNSIIFGIALVFVIIHAAYTCVWAYKLANPDTIVDATYGSVMLSAPEVGQAARKYLVDNSEVITDAILDQSFVALTGARKLALHQSKVLTAKLFQEAFNDIEKVTKDIILENKEEIQEAIDLGKDDGNISRVSPMIISEIEIALNPWMDNTISSLEVNLDSIGKQLSGWEDKNTLSSDEQLEKRFIDLWFQLLAKYFSEKNDLPS